MGNGSVFPCPPRCIHHSWFLPLVVGHVNAHKSTSFLYARSNSTVWLVVAAWPFQLRTLQKGCLWRDTSSCSSDFRKLTVPNAGLKVERNKNNQLKRPAFCHTICKLVPRSFSDPNHTFTFFRKVSCFFYWGNGLADCMKTFSYILLSWRKVTHSNPPHCKKAPHPCILVSWRSSAYHPTVTVVSHVRHSTSSGWRLKQRTLLN